MNYKELFNKLILILTSPTKAWTEIREEENTDQVQTGFVYPMVTICGLALFLGMMFDKGFDMSNLQDILIKCSGVFISMFGAYFFSSYLISRFIFPLSGLAVNNHNDCRKLVGYSMSILFVLDIFGGLFPSFFILRWILQFYLIYLVWEGAKEMMQIDEKHLLTYTLVSSVIILASPVLIDYIFGWLCKMSL